MASPVFALIIGIDSYKSGSIWNLHSCVDDAERVKRWLLDDLDVPKDQVRLLLDSQATKESFESNFMDHLVNNPCIRKGDAILIYFAGQGSHVAAPRDWYHGIRKPKSVEVLCTYDFDTKCASGPGRVAGISDRSMHAMLSELASVKGDNITLILDTCFSPSQTAENIRERSRTRWTPPIKTTADDLYRGLWPGARASPQHSQFGFLEPCPTSYVIVAACSPGHIAVEGKDGGRFTSGLLHALSDLSLHRTSYSQLLEYMNRQTTEHSQQAVCLGKHKSRVIFNEVPFITDPRFLSVTRGTDRDLRVEAGAIHGVVEGSELTLHLHNYRCSRNPSFANAVILQVHSTWSLARVKTQVSQIPKSCWARISRWNNHPSFHLKLKASVVSMIGVWRLKKDMPLEATRTLKESGITVQRVTQAKDADISVTVHRHDVIVERHEETFLGAGHKRVIKFQDTKPIKVINDAARFSLHLQSSHPEKPLENVVRMELYNIDSDTLTKVGNNLLLHNDDRRAIIHSGNSYNLMFTVIIQNMSKFDLWPYLMTMDPDSYAMSIVYQPELEDDSDSDDSHYHLHHRHPPRPPAPLPAGGTLEIATSWPQHLSLNFSSPRRYELASAKKSGFLKLLLASTPISSLGIFDENLPPSASSLPPPVFPFTFSRSSPNISVRDGASMLSSHMPVDHTWDTLLVHLTFVV